MNKPDSVGRYGEFMQRRETMHSEHCGMIGHTISTASKYMGSQTGTRKSSKTKTVTEQESTW